MEQPLLEMRITQRNTYVLSNCYSFTYEGKLGSLLDTFLTIE